MRQNIKAVISGWNWSRRVSHSSCSTDGVSIFSYETCLLTPIAAGAPNDGPFVFNVTKYSPTTSGQQTAIRGSVDVTLLEVDNVPMWTNACGLRTLGQKERAI